MKRTATRTVLTLILAGPAPWAWAQMAGHTIDQSKQMQAAQERQAAQTQQQQQQAQQRERAPREQASVDLGGKKVTIDYGRPALNGRTVDELMAKLGPDRVWRAGANQVTTLISAGDLLIAGKRLAAGKYSLYLFLPSGGDWHLVANTDPGIELKKIYAAASPEMANELWPRLDGYDKIAASEVLRVPLKRTTAAAAAERFQIALSPAKDGASAITFTWGDHSWTTDVKAAR